MIHKMLRNSIRAKFEFETESERNELKTVNQIRSVSAPITCQKNIRFETTLRIDWVDVIFFQTPDESEFDFASYNRLLSHGNTYPEHNGRLLVS
jgi:hypothetical protein